MRLSECYEMDALRRSDAWHDDWCDSDDRSLRERVIDAIDERDADGAARAMIEAADRWGGDDMMIPASAALTPTARAAVHRAWERIAVAPTWTGHRSVSLLISAMPELDEYASDRERVEWLIEVVRRGLLVREYETITEQLAEERARNIATIIASEFDLL